MLNKVLLFSNYPFDKLQGGPSGFILQNILGNETDGLVTLQMLEQSRKTPKYLTALTSLIKKIKFYQEAKVQKPWLDQTTTAAAEKYKKLKCARFRYIFFHDVFNLYGCLSLIPENQMVILQSHAPQLVSEEFAELNHTIETIEKVKSIEFASFQRANYLVFPHEGAKTIYDSLISKKSKLIYILSASRSINTTTQLPLSSDVNLLYIGRRNQVKGFDILIESFRKVRAIRSDINLLLAGEGDMIYDPGVISLGHLNPDIWITSVDYVVNVNRNSYFDLSVMEVLSAGTPIILTSNGGHQFFDKKSDGIITIKEPKEINLPELLLCLEKKTTLEKQKVIQQNIKLYQQYFTPEKYRVRLTEFIQNLLNDNFI